MTTSIFICILFFIMLWGLAHTIIHLRTAKIEENFVNEYYNKFASKYDAQEFDDELYIWLTKKANKIQVILGVNGILDYIGPFRQYRISNYQVIVNTLPKFRNGSIVPEDIGFAEDSLLRYSGVAEIRSEKYLSKLKNPIIWFQIGMQQILAIPITFLSYFGIYSIHTANKIKESIIWRIFSGLISLITFASAIIGIITGWDKMIEIWFSILK